MRLDRDQLATLAAVLRHGSFEGAAEALNLTQPAISLRIRALEETVGVTLVRRGVPCSGTDAGMRIARHAEDIALLEQDALADLSPLDTTHSTVVRLAVNADSLATWFVPVIGAAPELRLDVQIDDQDHSADWLRKGEVSAAVTGTSKPARGCDITYLGHQRYIATAAPEFVAQWFPDGVTPEALSHAPAFAFNVKDQLQVRWMHLKTGRKLFPPSHFLPSTHAFIDAARNGAGWGMNPLSLVEHDLHTGRLVALDADLPLDISLHWQISRRMKPALASLDKAVRNAAKTSLVRQ